MDISLLSSISSSYVIEYTYKRCRGDYLEEDTMEDTGTIHESSKRKPCVNPYRL
jgi:hypothetical protein